MKKDNSEQKRLIRIVVVLAVILTAVLATAIFWVSFEISNIKHSISDKDHTSYYLDANDMTKLSTQISKMVSLPAPIKGDKGDAGENGMDSVSTHTVVEQPMIIEKALPGEKGEKGDPGQSEKPMQFGVSKNGRPIWKYEQDREWQLFETIEVDL